MEKMATLTEAVYGKLLSRSEERRVGKSVDLGGRRIIKKKKKKNKNKGRAQVGGDSGVRRSNAATAIRTSGHCHCGIPSRTASCATVSGVFFFFQAEDGIRDYKVTGVQTCALPISMPQLPVAVPAEVPVESAAWI